MPIQCSYHYILDEEDRSVSTGRDKFCDTADPAGVHNEIQSKNWQGPGWYRFLPPAGLTIPTTNLGN